jgi:hypothetical protein
MMRAMAVAMRTPAFSDRHDSSFDDLFQLVAQSRAIRERVTLRAAALDVGAQTADAA